MYGLEEKILRCKKTRKRDRFKRDKANIRTRLRYDTHVGSADRKCKITMMDTLDCYMEKETTCIIRWLFQQRDEDCKKESNGNVQVENTATGRTSSTGWSVGATQLRKKINKLEGRSKN